MKPITCMMNKTYECRKCRKRRDARDAPDCCGERMVEIPLDACTTAFGAEHSRPMEDEGPCDDSR